MVKTKHAKGLVYSKAEGDGTSKATKSPGNLISLPYVPFALIRAFAIQPPAQQNDRPQVQQDTAV